VVKFKYLETSVTCPYEEIREDKILGMKNLSSSRLIPKYGKIQICGRIILPVDLHGSDI